MKTFYLKQKVFALRDRYKVFNEEQTQLYHCEGKMFSITQRMNLFDSITNSHLFEIRRKVFSFLPRYYLYDPSGNEAAFIKKRFTLFSHRLDITSAFGDHRIEGDVFAHNFRILQDEKEVVVVRKKWISWGDTYEITIYNDEHPAFYLALVLMIDACLHNRKQKSSNNSSSSFNFTTRGRSR